MLSPFEFKYSDYKQIQNPERRFKAFYRDWLAWSQEPRDTQKTREEFYRTQVRSNRSVPQDDKIDCVICLF